uniref:Leucine-rich repeat-containing protein 51 n=1 Tax=Crocodylus porosus TaxID=8502 RepID=A0A7M4FH01_CROPO
MAGTRSWRWNSCSPSLRAPPLDFSFRGISFLQDLQTEEPRAGPRAIPCSARGRMLTRAVRLNNNTLNELMDLGPTLELLLENPEELAWLDLSFNDLPTIDPILTTYRNLHCLQLHGNSIQGLGEVDKLAVLPHLRSLTLHGNPIEEEKGYRYPGMRLSPGNRSACPSPGHGGAGARGWGEVRGHPCRLLLPCMQPHREGVGVTALPRCPCQAGGGHRRCLSRPLSCGITGPGLELAKN